MLLSMIGIMCNFMERSQRPIILTMKQSNKRFDIYNLINTIWLLTN